MRNTRVHDKMSRFNTDHFHVIPSRCKNKWYIDDAVKIELRGVKK